MRGPRRAGISANQTRLTSINRSADRLTYHGVAGNVSEVTHHDPFGKNFSGHPEAIMNE